MVDKKRVTQIGILVRDVQHAAETWARYLDMPVPVIKETGSHAETNAVFNGKPCNGRIRQASFDLDNVQIELIEPMDDGNPSLWLECLQRDGEGIHHLAFEVKDMGLETGKCEVEQMACVQQGDFKNGRYAYVDARGQLGIILEYLERFGS